jgi:hypothetical protein
VSSALLKQCPGITLKLMVFFLTAVPRERISKMMNTPGMRQRNLLVSSSRTSMGSYGPAKNGDWSSPMLIETSSTPFTSNRRNRSKAVPAPNSMGEAPFRQHRRVELLDEKSAIQASASRRRSQDLAGRGFRISVGKRLGELVHGDGSSLALPILTAPTISSIEKGHSYFHQVPESGSRPVTNLGTGPFSDLSDRV